MALILKLLAEAKQNPLQEAIDTDGWVYDRVCRNPKCISAVEQELPQAAKLVEGTYRCVYCENAV
jgi:aspartate carbamoyltransferase regulatory subunit